MITVVWTLLCVSLFTKLMLQQTLRLSIFSLLFRVHALFSPTNLKTTVSLSQIHFLTPLCLSLSLSAAACLILCLSAFFFYGSLCVSLSVSDSQWVEKASLQIRASRSTRSLEYRTVRAQRHSDTYWISQRVLTKQLCVWEKNETNGERGRGCMVTCIWLCWFEKKKRRMYFFSRNLSSSLFLPLLLVSSLS